MFDCTSWILNLFNNYSLTCVSHRPIGWLWIMSTWKSEVAMAHLKYNPNISGGTEGNHTEDSQWPGAEWSLRLPKYTQPWNCTYPLFVNPSVMLGFIFLLLPKMEEFWILSALQCTHIRMVAACEELKSVHCTEAKIEGLKQKQKAFIIHNIYLSFLLPCPCSLVFHTVTLQSFTPSKCTCIPSLSLSLRLDFPLIIFIGKLQLFYMAT